MGHSRYRFHSSQNPTTGVSDAIDHDGGKNYAYDALDRINSAKGPWGSLEWIYDANGNRLSQKNGHVISYSYSANRLSSITGKHAYNHTYDAAGNTLGDGRYQFVFNQNNRMLGVIKRLPIPCIPASSL
jgi:hypothetical protein